MCGYNVQNISSVVEVNKSIYTRGCVEAMTEIFERNMNIVAGVCLGSAIIQVSVHEFQISSSESSIGIAQ